MILCEKFVFHWIFILMLQDEISKISEEKKIFHVQWVVITNKEFKLLKDSDCSPLEKKCSFFNLWVFQKKFHEEKYLKEESNEKWMKKVISGWTKIWLKFPSVQRAFLKDITGQNIHFFFEGFKKIDHKLQKYTNLSCLYISDNTNSWTLADNGFL